MKNTLRIFACLGIIIGLWACERPKSPDFDLNHDIEAPLTVNKTYKFLGGEDALIDSTSEDFADLFSAANDGLVTLSKEQEFDFGDLRDAIPEIDVPPTTVNPAVGEIELQEFASSGNVGSVGAGDFVTGGSNLQDGDHLDPGSANGIQINNFNPDYFQSATVAENGSINIELTNNLGFNADNDLTVRLKSNGSVIGSDNISPLNHSNTTTATFDVSAGDQLSNLGVEIDVGWSDQTMQADAGSLVITSVYGEDDSNPSDGLFLSQVTAKVASQSFDANGSTNVNNSNFEFRESNDVIVLSDSTQNVNKLTLDITNNISIGIQNVDITFPEIEDPQGNPFTINMTSIQGNGSKSQTYDISEHAITSETVTYTVSARTENTQDNANPSTINSSDDIIANVNLQSLNIRRINGYIVPREVLLNEDVTNDGRENLDVFNDDEAEITNVDGISDLSDRISDITFENPVLKTKYFTNLGVNTIIYAVIVGIDSNGNRVYLKGEDNNNDGISEYDVTSSEIPDGLEVNGQPATTEQVVKFSLETVNNPSQGDDGENVFNSSNTNSSEFFSNLPTSIRFAGIAVVNEEQTQGALVNPVEFEPTLNFDLPFNFSANNASFKDTLDADLSDLPGDEEDQKISKADFTINYENGLPLDLDLTFIMIDENGNEITRKGGIEIGAATTNNDGEVAQGGTNKNKVPISFTEAELENLNDTRSLILDIGINTPQQNAVKIKASDTIKFYMEMKVQITSTVN